MWNVGFVVGTGIAVLPVRLCRLLRGKLQHFVHSSRKSWVTVIVSSVIVSRVAIAACATPPALSSLPWLRFLCTVSVLGVDSIPSRVVFLFALTLLSTKFEPPSHFHSRFVLGHHSYGVAIRSLQPTVLSSQCSSCLRKRPASAPYRQLSLARARAQLRLTNKERVLSSQPLYRF